MSAPIPRVLALLPGIMPSTLMNVVKPMLALQHRGQVQLRVSLENYPSNSYINWSDIVLFCRNTEPRYRNNLDLILERRIPYIFDLDDNLFDVPADTNDGKYYRTPERIELLERYLANASLVRVYSNPLLEVVRRYNSNNQKVAPPIEWETLAAAPKTEPVSLLKIVYATSRKEDRMISIFSEALSELLVEYPQDIEMYFWGFRPVQFKEYPNVRYRKFSSNYDRFLRQFANTGFDIGLAPLNNDRFHLSKTNNKFREYASCYIAGIYSDVAVYSDCVKDRETGLLVANTPDAWYAGIKTLIEDENLRSKISLAGRAWVENQYSSKKFQDEWVDQINSVIDLSSRPSHTGAAEPSGEQVRTDSESVRPVSKQWIEKSRRAFQSGDSMRTLFSNIFLHLSNFWWLVKFNLFKRA